MNNALGRGLPTLRISNRFNPTGPSIFVASPPVKTVPVALALWTVATFGDARAADMPLPTVPAPYDWSGFYFGGHLGIAGGQSRWIETEPGSPSVSGTIDFFQPPDGFNGFGSQFAGLSAGYDYRLPSRFVVGAVA